mgnify:CR=1 FL=1
MHVISKLLQHGYWLEVTSLSKEAYEPSPKAKGRRTRLEQEDKRIIEKEEYRKVANEVFSIDKKQLNKIINSKKKEIVDKVYEYAQENDLDRISYNKVYEIFCNGISDSIWSL